MKTRLALLLILVMALMPATVSAQADDDVAPDGAETALIAQLCAATAADAAEQADCISAVSLALAEMAGTELLGEQDAFDEALTRVRELDLQAALDEAVASLDGLELGVDVDLQAAIDEATAAAMAATEELDLAAAVDDALAGAMTAIEDAGVRAAIDDALIALQERADDARAVVAEAQRWAQQNSDAVCRGGSLSLGTTVGLAVFALTGVEWLGLQAFWATERFSNGLCGNIVE